MTRFLLKLMTVAATLITFCFSLSAQDKLVPGEGDVEVFNANGGQFGVWHPDTRVFELTYVRKTGSHAGQHVTFTFKDDGNVFFDTGSVAGTMAASGSMTAPNGLKDIQVSTRYIMQKLSEIGTVNDRCDIYIYGQKAYYCSAPMDKNALVFAAVCASLNDQDLANYKKARDNRAKQDAAKAPRPTVGRNAAKLEILGDEVKACDAKGVWIGSAKKESDGRIYLYTAKSTGSVGCIQNDGYIDFRGFSNYLRYSYSEQQETYFFTDEKGMNVVRVEHNSGSRNYEVRDEKTRNVLATFPDTIDGRFGAMLIYGFFDK